MQTGLFVYADKTVSRCFNSRKPLKGIYCRISETRSVIIRPIETPRKLKWEEAQAFCSLLDCKAPSRQELYGIWMNKKTINKQLFIAGLPEIKDEFYWAADKNRDNLAFGLNMFDGSGFEINARGRCLILPIIPLLILPHNKER